MWAESSWNWKLHNTGGQRWMYWTIHRWVHIKPTEGAERELGGVLKEEKVKGRNEKRMVAKLSPSVCQFPLTSQKWPIMFNILSLSGGGKEQRCRVGRLEESSVANSIVNIIPYHLLPVKAQAKFVLRRTHGSPVAKKQRDTEWATRAPRSTLPWKLCQLLTPTA